MFAGMPQNHTEIAQQPAAVSPTATNKAVPMTTVSTHPVSTPPNKRQKLNPPPTIAPVTSKTKGASSPGSRQLSITSFLHQRNAAMSSSMSTKRISDASTIVYGSAHGSVGQNVSTDSPELQLESHTDNADATGDRQRLWAPVTTPTSTADGNAQAVTVAVQAQQASRSTLPSAMPLGDVTVPDLGSREALSQEGTRGKLAQVPVHAVGSQHAPTGADPLATSLAQAEGATAAADHTTAAADSTSAATDWTTVMCDTVTGPHPARAEFWKGKGYLGPCPLQQPILEGICKIDRTKPG